MASLPLPPPWPLHVAVLPGRERSLVAPRGILGGEVVLADVAVVLAVESDSWQECCQGCLRWFRSLDSPVTCDICRQSRFCNASCQSHASGVSETSEKLPSSFPDLEEKSKRVSMKVTFGSHSSRVCSSFSALKNLKYGFDSESRTAVRWLLAVFNVSQRFLKKTKESQTETEEETKTEMGTGTGTGSGRGTVTGTGIKTESKGEGETGAEKERLEHGNSVGMILTGGGGGGGGEGSSSGTKEGGGEATEYFQKKVNGYLKTVDKLNKNEADIIDLLLGMDGGDFAEVSEREKVENFRMIFTFLNEILDGDEWGGKENLTFKLLSTLITVYDRNSFAVMAPTGPEGERRVRANATYPLAALANHSCFPNVCRYDAIDREGSENIDISFRAMRDIEEGTEICISYFPINWTRKERQFRLKEDYGFDCFCARCQMEAKWDDSEEDEDSEEDKVEKEEDEICEEGEEDESKAEKDEHSLADTLSKLKVDGEKKMKEAQKGKESVVVEEEGEEEESGSEEWEEVEDGEDHEEMVQHSMFFLRHLCYTENCGGSMAPRSGKWVKDKYKSDQTLECNVCGRLVSENEFVSRLQELNV